LNDVAVYAPYLSAVDTVVHFAAATGKRPAREYYATNANGTRALLEQCVRAGVRRFLFASTIAVKYPDITGYDYAQSKSAAEEFVKESGLQYAIIRPTIVIGREGAAWQSLLRLARIPVMLVFGDGKTRIQPIYIEDLVDCIRLILSEGLFANQAFDLGGPEIISFDGFFRAIGRCYRRNRPLILHVPAKAVIPWLAIAEKRFHSYLPLSAGQLAVFNNNGTIEANDVFRRQAPHMKNVDEMLRQVTTHD
jgi:NADH dehydrogenase